MSLNNEMSALSLDTPVSGDELITLISPAGTRFTIPRGTIESSNYLSLRAQFNPEQTEFQIPEEGAASNHELANLSDKFLKLIADYMTASYQAVEEKDEEGNVKIVKKAVTPKKAPDQVTMFDPDLFFARKENGNYWPWPLVRDLTYEETAQFDRIVLFWGNEGLFQWNEVRMAFHIKEWSTLSEEEIAEKKKLIQHVIDRDVAAEEAKRAAEDK